MNRWKALLLGMALVLVGPADALAHWCSNIWVSPARILVKPEKSTIYVSSKPTTFRVYVQNNFPYALFSLEVRGNAAGYKVTASPSTRDIQPGQNVSFALTVTRTGSAGNVQFSTLGLELKFRPGHWPYGWFDDSDRMRQENPTKSFLSSDTKYSMSRQWASLSVATLVRRYPNTKLGAGQPFFDRTGLQQLIHWFGYRFCYSSSGNWRCGNSDCPSTCKEGSPWTSVAQFPQNCMRAAVEIAALHARAKLGSQLQPARDAAVNALKDGSTKHRCLAALVGAYLFRGSASTATFKAALSGAPKACENAALRLLGSGPKPNCDALGPAEEQAVCAAAEGLLGDDGPVRSVLLKNAGDGYSPGRGGYDSLFHAYVLYIVTEHRMAKPGKVSYYPDAGAPFFTVDRGKLPDKGGSVDGEQPGKDGSDPGKDGSSTADKGSQPKPDGGSVVGGDEGCSCATSSSRGPWLMLLLALAAILGRRRLLP